MTFSIADHGVLIQRLVPPHALEDVAARRRAVLRALEILQPVVRPLALEIALGPLDPETFAVESREIRRIAVRAIPPGVANPSGIADPPQVEQVDRMSPEVIERALTPSQPGWDLSVVTATVTAARIGSDELVIDTMPSRSVPTIELDGARWVVGPVDAPGYRLSPPIALSWEQMWGDLQVTIDARWSLWWPVDSAEFAGLRAVERALDAAGFTAAPS